MSQPPKRSAEFYTALHEKARECSADDFLYLLCKIDDSSEFRRALQNRATICPADEFKALLMIFGEKQAALAIFQQAVNSRAYHDGRKNADEAPTPVYTNFITKKNLLIDCHLHMGPFRGVFNDVADPPETNLIKLFKNELEELAKAVKVTVAQTDAPNQPKAPKVIIAMKSRSG